MILALAAPRSAPRAERVAIVLTMEERVRLNEIAGGATSPKIRIVQ